MLNGLDIKFWPDIRIFIEVMAKTLNKNLFPKMAKKRAFLGFFLENRKVSPKKDVFRLACINQNLKYYLIQIQTGLYHFPK